MFHAFRIRFSKSNGRSCKPFPSYPISTCVTPGELLQPPEEPCTPYYVRVCTTTLGDMVGDTQAPRVPCCGEHVQSLLPAKYVDTHSVDCSLPSSLSKSNGKEVYPALTFSEHDELVEEHSTRTFASETRNS